ncbi:hypothetical protein [Nostoc sp.]|uniref:hypothetical protein n=1 Tax=Nostoc sp. TaxID=1180 RepID=UPI000B95B4AB|nr:hypothetical protein CDG79_00920 [Nostoc sp. 'Peltigera membranacea cyanobiont' 232]
MTNQNVNKSCRFSFKVLHLFTQTIAANITQHYSLVKNSDAFHPSIPFYPPNTAGNQPATGWFLFQNMLP